MVWIKIGLTGLWLNRIQQAIIDTHLMCTETDDIRGTGRRSELRKARLSGFSGNAPARNRAG
jgi:hypothetical protein